MFTKTEKMLISVIITAALLALLSMCLSDPNAASAKELPVITWIQYEPTYHENTECIGVENHYDIQKFTNPEPVPTGGGDPPFVGTTDAAQISHSTAAAGSRLTKSKGVHMGPSGKETWYSLDMTGVIRIMRNAGFSEDEYPYWVDEDGLKRLGPYIMIAANLELRPRGSIVMTSWGEGLVCDTGTFCQKDKTAIDIATNWK